MVSKEKLDCVYNALLVGMTMEDAYVYAALTPDEVSQVSEDPYLQAKWRKLTRSFEHELLTKLQSVMDKQVRMGKENAVVWALEHMFSRYGNKQTGGGDVHIHMDSTDPKDMETVEIHVPDEAVQASAGSDKCDKDVS